MSPAGFVSVYAAGNEEVTSVRAIERGLYISGYVNGELIGLASTELVDVEVTIMTPAGQESH